MAVDEHHFACVNIHWERHVRVTATINEEIAPVTVTVQRLPDFGDPMEITQRHMESACARDARPKSEI